MVVPFQRNIVFQSFSNVGQTVISLSVLNSIHFLFFTILTECCWYWSTVLSIIIKTGISSCLIELVGLNFVDFFCYFPRTYNGEKILICVAFFLQILPNLHIIITPKNSSHHGAQLVVRLPS